MHNEGGGRVPRPRGAADDAYARQWGSPAAASAGCGGGAARIVCKGEGRSGSGAGGAASGRYRGDAAGKGAGCVCARAAHACRLGGDGVATRGQHVFSTTLERASWDGRGPVRGLGAQAVVGSAERREAQVSRGPAGGVAS